MKTFRYILMMLLGGLLFMTSCENMEEVHQKYIKNGEIIYRAKPANVVGYSGKNRLKLTWQLINPTLVTKCEIREGSKVLAEIPVEYKDLLDMEYTLSDLEEKTYTLSIYSLDDEGNSSIKSDIIVEVYGDRYTNALKTGRSLKSVFRRSDNEQTALVTLSEKTSSKVYGTDIFYKSISGVEKSVRLLENSNRIEISDVADDSYFNIQDLYQPVATSIDLFPAALRKYTVNEIPANGARTFSSLYKEDATTVTAKLTEAAVGTIHSIISYGNQELIVEPTVSNVVLENVSPDAVISISTVFIDEESQNEYLTPTMRFKANELACKVNMADWTVTDFSSQQESGEGAGGGHASHTIDGDFATYWHTQYSPASPNYPHYLVVDMKSAHEVKAIAVARRNNNNNMATRMKLEVSTDGTTWTSAGEFAPDNSINGLQMFSLSNPSTGRYFKLTALTSGTSNNYMCLSEINIYE